MAAQTQLESGIRAACIPKSLLMISDTPSRNLAQSAGAIVELLLPAATPKRSPHFRS